MNKIIIFSTFAIITAVNSIGSKLKQRKQGKSDYSIIWGSLNWTIKADLGEASELFIPVGIPDYIIATLK